MTKKRQEYFMRQAMLIGKKALANCHPNPPVGCVIVKNGKIIASGYTNKPGSDHAEAMALKQVPPNLKNLEIFVTLEPCSFQGRTPSCAKAIAKRQVKMVYVGIIDPHPKNRGAGIEILQNAEIEVVIGILAKEIQQELNPYLILESD